MLIIVAIIVIILLLKFLFAIIALGPVILDQQQQELHIMSNMLSQIPVKF